MALYKFRIIIIIIIKLNALLYWKPESEANQEGECATNTTLLPKILMLMLRLLLFFYNLLEYNIFKHSTHQVVDEASLREHDPRHL